MKAKRNSLFPQWVNLCLCGAALVSSATAADVVKANNVTNMNLTTSWEGGVVPTATDVIVFDDIFTQTAVVGTGAPLSYAGIRVEGSSVTSLININNTTTANHVAPGALGIDMSNSPRGLTIASLQADVDQTWKIGNATALQTLTLAGSKLAGSGQITVQGPGNLTLGTNNTLTKGLIVDGARILTSTAGGFGSAAVTQQILNGGGAYISAAVTIPANFEIAGNGWTEPSGQLGAIRLTGTTVSGNILLKSNARITAHGSTGTLSGVISDGGDNFALDLGNYSTTANTTLTVSGSAPNTYAGGTTVTGAIVRGLKDGAFGTGDITVQSNGTAARVTRLQLEGVTLNNNIFLSSNAFSDFRGALHASGGLVSTVNGTVTVTSPVGNGGHFAAENNTTSVLRIMGPINVAGTVTSPLIRIGTVELGGGGNYPSIGHAQGILRLAANDGINPTAALPSGTSGTTTFDLNGFNQTLARFTTGANATTITNEHPSNPSTLTLTGNDNSAFGIFNPGPTPLHLVKNGTSTLSINGISSGAAANTVTVNTGGLTLNGQLGLATNVTVADAATLGGEGIVGGNLTLGTTTGAKLVIDAASVGTLRVDGNVAVGGVVEVLSTTAPVGAPVEVLSYGGTLTATAANFSAPGFRGATFNVGTGSNSMVTMSFGAPVNLTWSGSTNNLWTAGGETNWTDPATAPDKFFTSDSVLFNDTAAGSGLITLTVPTGVSAGDVTFNHSSKNFRVEGPGTISGLNLVKNGTGTTTLATAGTFSGFTDVLGGTLTLDLTNGNPVAGTSSILIEDGATLRVVHQTAGFAFDRALVGEGSVVIQPRETAGDEAPLTVTLTGNNTSFAGNLLLASPASGTARVNGPLPSALGSASITVANNNQLLAATNQTYTNPITLTGSGYADTGGFLGALRLENGTSWDGPVTLTGTAGDSAGTTPDATIGTFNSTANSVATINGPISGGDLLLTGYNTTTSENIVLSAANTFGDLIVAASDTPTSGQVTAIIGNSGTTATNTTATLGTGTVYLRGGAAGKFAALRIQRGDGYTLTQDVLGGGADSKTLLNADTTGTGLTLGGRTVNIGDQIRLGANVNGAILNIDPGSSVSAGFIYTGNAANNSTVVNQSGGTVTVRDHVRIAHFSTETSFWNMTGGSLNINGQPLSPSDGGPNGGVNEAPGMLYVGVEGQGIFNQSAGSVSAYGLVLDTRTATGINTNMTTGIDEYNLTGGTLTLNASGIRGNGSTAFNLGGGSLIAAADFTSTLPLNLTAAGSTLETNGFFLTLGGGITGAFPLTISSGATSGGLLVLTPTGASTIAASLTGNAGVRLNGSGSLTLSGTNTYTGPTEIWQGTLAITGSLAGTNLALDGGTLATGGSLTGNLDLSPQFSSKLDYTGSPLAVTGNVKISGFVEVDPIAAAPLAAGTYPLVTYTGTLTGNSSSISLPAGQSPGDYRQTFSFSAGAGAISLVVTGSASNLVWNGPGDWDLKTSPTWNGGNVFYFLDAVTFNDTAASGAVNITSEVRPASILVDNTTLPYTFSGTGTITGSASLRKKGTGSLTLSTANPYTGGTVIEAGRVTVNAVGALGTGPVTLSSGTLAVVSEFGVSNGQTITLGDANTGTAETIIEVPVNTTTAGDRLVFDAPIIVSSAAPNSKAILRYPGGTSGAAMRCNSPVTLQGRDLHLENNSIANPTGRLWNMGGKISGVGNVHIDVPGPSGNGRVRLLNATNDWQGNLFVNTGHVQVGSGGGGNITAIPDTANVTVAANATLALGQGDTIAGLFGAGEIRANLSSATSTVTLVVGASDASGVFSGTTLDLFNQSGGGRVAFTKIGTGTQVINGVFNHLGATNANGGVLELNNTVAGSVTVGAAGTVAGTGSLSSTLTATALGAKVRPGQGTTPGTLNVTGTANLSTGGTLEILIDDASAAKNGKLAAAGTLNITNATLNVTVTGAPNQSVYPIATYSTLTGTFATTNLPAGYELVLNHESTNTIALVKVGGGDYAQWASEFPGFTDTAPTSDPDGDGMSNQQEYAFGLNPTSGTSVSPILSPLGKAGLFTYTRRNPSLTGLDYKVRTSTTLLAGSWATDATALQEVIATNGDTQTVRVTVTGTLLAADRLFARIEAAAP